MSQLNLANRFEEFRFPQLVSCLCPSAFHSRLGILEHISAITTINMAPNFADLPKFMRQTGNGRKNRQTASRPMPSATAHPISRDTPSMITSPDPDSASVVIAQPRQGKTESSNEPTKSTQPSKPQQQEAVANEPSSGPSALSLFMASRNRTTPQQSEIGPAYQIDPLQKAKAKSEAHSSYASSKCKLVRRWSCSNYSASKALELLQASPMK